MAFSFIGKRYKRDPRSYMYVDSISDPLAEPTSELLEHDNAPKIPLDSPTHFLNIPTEIRLEIYGWLTMGNESPNRYNGTLPNLFDLRSGSGTQYVYLYRSPGRCTRPNSLSRSVMDLFHVCHQIRVELLDAFFSERVFVLEASFYSKDTGGLRVVPPNLGPMTWLRRLLILTVLQLNGPVKGIADLRLLQQMTSLEELQIVFVVQRRREFSSTYPICNVPDDLIKAILECVPKSARIHLGPTAALEKKLLSALGPGVQYLLSENVEETSNVLSTLKDDMDALCETQGRLSGSCFNHGVCHYPKCLEGLGCVNSHGPKHATPAGKLPLRGGSGGQQDGNWNEPEQAVGRMWSSRNLFLTPLKISKTFGRQ